MITSAPEALALHEKMAKELWAARHQGAGGGGTSCATCSRGVE